MTAPADDYRGPVRPARILLVEDDETIGRHLAAGLGANGYAVTRTATGRDALLEFGTGEFDLVLLDLGLPDVDGTDVARDLRVRDPDLLIVMLTARGDDMDVVVGLDLGADDYLVKPVALDVLLARLRAHLRRAEPGPGEAAPIGVGALSVDLAARRCLAAGREIALRPKEFDLLAELVQHAGEAVRREDLMAGVWDEHWFGSTKTLDVTMSSLRQRLEEAARAAPAGGMPVITTLRGHGYRLDPPEPA